MLLHGGEFGASARIGWENTIDALAARHRVLAPDMLGFGESAKVVDFTDGRGMRIRHIARFCEVMGVESAHFVGNSMGAINLLVDATSDAPMLPVRSLVTICGGGDIQRNDHVSCALRLRRHARRDARGSSRRCSTTRRTRRTTTTCGRRYESSIAPGAWESLAAARFRRPGLEAPSTPSSARAYDRIARPDPGGGGRGDKLLPPGWAAEIAAQIPHGRSAVVDDAGHCPQIEQPQAVNALLLDFFEGISA